MMRRRIAAALGRSGPDPRLGAPKLRAIDAAFGDGIGRSVADLGGVWAVDGGYALYALDRYKLDRAVICDDDFTTPLTERADTDPKLQLVRGNFGDPDAAEAVGAVDAILLFDVLLHQVRPDWDEVIQVYATRTEAFVLAGPWWNGPETVRLVDLTREEYLSLVPLPDFHATVIDRLDEFNPRRGRLWRDCHDIWQWGITEGDLKATMSHAGFELFHREEAGSWMGLERFDDLAFVFRRAGRDGGAE